MPRDAVEAERKAGRLSGDFEYHPQLGTPYGMVRRFLLGPENAPAVHAAAVGHAGGGQGRDRRDRLAGAARPVPRHREACPTRRKSGSIALGGPIATAGGLVFTAGTLEGGDLRVRRRAPASSCGRARCRPARARRR